MSISVKYNRLPGYPQEVMDWTGAEAVDKLQCAWEDRIILTKELLGYVVGGKLYPPHQYEGGGPELPGLLALDVSIAPLMSIGETGDYSKAELTVRYGIVDLVTESLESTSEFLTLDEDELYWAPGGAEADKVKPASAPRMILRRMEWVLSIHRTAFLPNWIWTYPGCVNSAPFYSWRLNKLFESESLLCGNPSLSRELTTVGPMGIALTIRFMYQPAGWNNFPRTNIAGDLVLRPIYSKTGSYPKKFYKPVNFGVIVTG